MTDQATGERNAAFPVVAIGASAGGVEQLQVLMREIPEDSGAAFVVLLHLAPDKVSHLTSLLGRACRLEVVTIRNRMPLTRDRVHVIPAGYSLGIQGNRFRLTATESHRQVTHIVDGFFRALAEARKDAAVGIILSGSGSDGALGLKAIKANGGLALAQNPDEAEYDGMPRAAAKSVALDYVLGTAALVKPLVNHLRLNFRIASGGPTSRPPPIEVGDTQLNAILETLHRHGGQNFASYKSSMLKRRIVRRMGLNGLRDVADYRQLLEDDAHEHVSLSRDFLISVTDFFRNPHAYTRLAELCLAPLLKGRQPGEPLRIWVPGCATGEEAYSIAMLAAEAVDETGHGDGDGPEFIVFASDIDQHALDFARKGLYPDSIVADVSDQRLRRFCERIDHHFRIRSSLRERVVFANQNVVDDPPYSGLDLISCRNLLMYLKPKVQKQVLSTFHFALNTNGFLALGNSETVGEEVDLFEPVGDERRLFRRTGPNQRARARAIFPHRAPSRIPAIDEANESVPLDRDNVEKIARDILLQHYVPASVLINRKLEILCGYGPTSDYFALPFGQSSLGAVDMVRPQYRNALRAATHRAFRDQKTSSIVVPATNQGRDQASEALKVSAQFLDAPESARGLVLVTFRRTPLAEPGTQALSPGTDEMQGRLAEELDDTRRELHTTILALEASNEDMKGSHEEILSINEELQSANEELETSAAELQSVNEELTTVNSELEHKVAELETARNDLDNLLAGTQVATLFLDRSLAIKRFTPTIRELLNIVSTDVGRSLDEIKFKVDDPDLVADAEAVLESLAPSERDVQAQAGTWYLRRALPYRSQKDTIEGVIVTYVDISPLMRLTLDSIESERRLDLALSAIHGGIWDIPLDPDAPEQLPDAIYLSARFKSLLGFAEDQFPNSLHSWRERIVEQDRMSADEIKALQAGINYADLRYRIVHRDGTLRWFSSHGRLVHDEHGLPVRWIGVDFDITDEQQRQLDARRSAQQLRLLANAIPWPLAFVDTDHALQFANSAYEDWFGNSDVTWPVATTLGARFEEPLALHIKAALAGRTVSCDLTLDRPDIGECILQATMIPHAVEGTILGCYLLMIGDSNTSPGDSARPGRHAGLIYLQRMATLGELTGALAHDLKQPLHAINSYAGAITRMVHAGEPPEKTVPLLRKIADQVTHAGNLITHTRDFLGRRETGTVPTDLNALVDRALTLTESMAKERNVVHQLDLYKPLPLIECHAVQIEQVIINLIINALDAMDSVGREARHLRLTTRQTDTGHVQLAVADSGEGVAPAHIGQIFETFYTSKLEGLGVGLSLGRTIVEDHGGTIWVESQLGHGATFYLRLPIVAPVAITAPEREA